MEIKISLHPESYVCKPKDKRVIAKISNEIADKQATQLLKEVARLVGEEGHTFCPAIFCPARRKRDCFKEMQLFVMDFDSGCTYETIKKKCEKYGFPIAFSYDTFSSTPQHPRFRVALCHAVPIAEGWLANMMMDMLKSLFPEADVS